MYIQLKPMEDGRRNMALFHPSDGRMPRMKIPSDQLPDGFFERPQDFSKYIFVARISKWPVISRFAQGKLQRQLGLVGDIEAETEGMLITNEVDTREFSKAALRCLPISSAKEWKIDKVNLKEALICPFGHLTHILGNSERVRVPPGLPQRSRFYHRSANGS